MNRQVINKYAVEGDYDSLMIDYSKFNITDGVVSDTCAIFKEKISYDDGDISFFYSFGNYHAIINHYVSQVIQQTKI